MLRLGAAALAVVAAAGCSESLRAELIRGGTPETTQSMETSAAVVAAEENGFLEAVRPEWPLFARVAGAPGLEDSTVLAYGYGVCLHAARTGDTLGEMKRHASTLGEGPESDGARAAVILARAAHATICG